MKRAAIFIFYYVYLFFSKVCLPQIFETGSFTISFLNIGQGDATLVTTPNGKTVLIDGGPGFDVSMYLNDGMFGPLCHLDAIILTHPHADHIIGLNRVLEYCDIGVVYTNKVGYTAGEYKDFVGMTAKNSRESSAVRPFLAGNRLKIDGVDFTVFWPTKEYLKDFSALGKYPQLNLVSTVFLISYKDFEVLYTGDAEKPVLDRLPEEALMSEIRGKLDVIKVPHHGSRTGLTTSLFQHLQIEKAVMSVGKDNKFNHPHSEALDFYKSINAKIYRTDLDNTITFYKQ